MQILYFYILSLRRKRAIHLYPVGGSMSWKGTLGERKVGLKLLLALDKKNYHRFGDLIIPSKNGTTQIDQLIVSQFGLFIVEVKNKDGWIFGSVDGEKWTQTFPNGKFTFQNPLRQMYRQKKVLEEFLLVHESLIHSVAYFVGDCEFKTDMPVNVLNSGLAKYIQGFKEPIIKQEQVSRIVMKLKNYLASTGLTLGDHLQSLRERHSSTTKCPKCGSALVLRQTKSGTRAGEEFMGCSNFPTCRFSKSA